MDLSREMSPHSGPKGEVSKAPIKEPRHALIAQGQSVGLPIPYSACLVESQLPQQIRIRGNWEDSRLDPAVTGRPWYRESDWIRVRRGCGVTHGLDLWPIPLTDPSDGVHHV